MSIGENLRRIRKERRLGQIELAEASGTSQPTISEIETGQRDPHQSTLQKLADALGVPVTAFFSEEPSPKGPPPRPRTPLTSESEEEFDRRLSKADTERKARTLREAVNAEIDELVRWERALKEWGADPATILQARKLLQIAGKRFNAAALLWTEFVVAGDTKRKRPIEKRVADDGVEETARRTKADNRSVAKTLLDAVERQRIEEAGEAG